MATRSSDLLLIGSALCFTIGHHADMMVKDFQDQAFKQKVQRVSMGLMVAGTIGLVGTAVLKIIETRSRYFPFST